MELRINENHLRLLGKTFMFYQLSRNGKFSKNSIYKCYSEYHGHLGEVKCLISYELPLHEVKPAVLWLSDGRSDGIDTLKSNGAKSLDLINVCLFSFIRKTESGFTKLLEKELPNAGIILTKQQQLF